MSKDLEEDIVQEYIKAIKYHIDNNLLTKKELSLIHKECVNYIKEKGFK